MSNDLADWGTPDEENGAKKWRMTREKILMFTGVGIIVASFINSELLGGTFHYEFLIVGAALCGISITQWGDRK